MKPDYKIYYNNSYLLITADRAQINNNFANVFDTETKVEEFLTKPDILFDGTTGGPLLIVTPKPDEALRNLREILKLVLAGGGIVFNEHDELLMIYRRGHWDLPKGKIEKDEGMLDGAIREVTEETGAEIESVEETPIITYHAYILKGKESLKHTEWFVMCAKAGQSKLSPQTEEDIDEVKWVKKSDLKLYKDISYPLIWGLISKYAE